MVIHHAGIRTLHRCNRGIVQLMTLLGAVLTRTTRTGVLLLTLRLFLALLLGGHFIFYTVESASQLLQGEATLLTCPLAIGYLRDLLLAFSNLGVSLLARLCDTLNLLLQRELSGLGAARTLAALTLLAGRGGLLRALLVLDRGCGHGGHRVAALGLLRLQRVLLLLVTRILAGGRTGTLTLVTVVAMNEVGGTTTTATQRLIVNNQTAASAMLARLREDLKQAGAQALAGHLNQTQRSHLGHLMLGAVAAQALNQSAQHQVTVRLEHHVDEVNHDDAADIAQTQLTHNLLSRLQVVLGDGLFKIAAATGELTGVHVHHGHGLGAVNHERATRGQVDLAVQSLSQLLVNAVVIEEVLLAVPLLQARNQVGCHVGHVGFDGIPGILTLNDHRGEVLVEDVTHGLNHQVRLLIEHLRSQHLAGVSLLLNLFPLRAQTVNVVGQLLLGGTLSRGAHNHAGTLGQLVLQNLLQTRTLGVGQLARNTGH